MILVGLYVSCVGSNMFGKIQKNDRNTRKKDREVYANFNFVIGNCLAYRRIYSTYIYIPLPAWCVFVLRDFNVNCKFFGVVHT